MKELKQRSFLINQDEFKKKLGLPEQADIIHIENTADGIVINVIGEII